VKDLTPRERPIWNTLAQRGANQERNGTTNTHDDSRGDVGGFFAMVWNASPGLFSGGDEGQAGKPTNPNQGTTPTPDDGMSTVRIPAFSPSSWF
jgi:hypothetical protein